MDQEFRPEDPGYYCYTVTCTNVGGETSETSCFSVPAPPQTYEVLAWDSILQIPIFVSDDNVNRIHARLNGEDITKLLTRNSDGSFALDLNQVRKYKLLLNFIFNMLSFHCYIVFIQLFSTVEYVFIN